ncbi:MAG: glycerophosphodiester phosphodiesterase family protein [Rikenellaceae bacterium]
MKQLLILVSLVACAFSCTSQPAVKQEKTASRHSVSEIRNAIFNPSDSVVLVIAHRGEWRYAPENSVAAIERSIELGADIIEIDVQKTSDGVLVLMHDNTINRTTTGKGAISDYTYADLQALSLRNGCGAVTRNKIPTLIEALDAVKGKALVNLDKADKYFDEVYALLDSTSTIDLVVMKGSEKPSIVKEKYGKYLEKIIYMPVVHLDGENVMDLIEEYERELNPEAYELVYTNPNNPIVKPIADKLHAAGKTVWFNTLWETLAGGYDDDAALEDADGVYGYLIRELNTRMIQTDRSEQLLEYLRTNNLHK